MIESIYAEAFITSRLAGDALLVSPSALGGPHVYKYWLPQGGPAPAVVVSLMDADDVNSGNKARLFVRLLFQVRTVGKLVGSVLQDAARFRTAAHRADGLLNVRRQSHTVEGVTFFFNVWRAVGLSFELPGPTADLSFRVVGGLYWCEVFE